MHDEMIGAILKRLDELERECVRLRKGVVTNASPLNVAMGGAATSYLDVPQLIRASTEEFVPTRVMNGRNIAALVRGNDLLVLGELA